jgi:citrate lyase alpha subunit
VWFAIRKKVKARLTKIHRENLFLSSSSLLTIYEPLRAQMSRAIIRNIFPSGREPIFVFVFLLP